MSRRKSRAAVVVTAVAAVVSVATAAWAYYAFTSTTSNRVVIARSLSAATSPSATVAGSTTVSLGWTLPASQVTGAQYAVTNTVDNHTACTVAATVSTCSDTAALPGVVNTYSIRTTLAGSTWVSAATTFQTPTATPGGLALTFPAANVYNSVGWTAGCGTASTDDICGTSAGAASVSVSVRLGSGNYWNGASFGSAPEVLLPATGTSSWSLGFAGTRFTTGSSYTVRVVAGSVSASKTFSWDTSSPTAQNAVSADVAGTAGKIEATDKLTLTDSEAIDPTSIAAGWNGASMTIVVHGSNDSSAGGKDELTIFNSTNALLPIGTVDLGDTAYFTGNLTFGATGTAATMSLSSGTLVITLGTVSDASKLGTVAKSKLVWTPSATAKDLAGNACSTASFQTGNVNQF